MYDLLLPIIKVIGSNFSLKDDRLRISISRLFFMEKNLAPRSLDVDKLVAIGKSCKIYCR